jgi:hypothetical protein
LKEIAIVIFLVEQVLGRGPEQRESKETVLCPLVIIILISYIIIYHIIIKLLIMENHPSWNQKWNSVKLVKIINLRKHLVIVRMARFSSLSH